MEEDPMLGRELKQGGQLATGQHESGPRRKESWKHKLDLKAFC